MSSDIAEPRSSETRPSPNTQRTASMMFDLPQPFGPTMAMSGSRISMTVGSAKLLKPAILI